MKKSMISSLLLGLFVGSANAGLVAKWDFNNYNPADPLSADVLKATVGKDGKPCYCASKGTALVTDGTLGEMYVVSSDYTGADADVLKAAAGLGSGNYAVAIPKNSHIALPIPDSVKNHVWTMKIRFWQTGNNDWHSFFNRNNTTDGDLFIGSKNNSRVENGLGGGAFGRNNSYKTGISHGTWHTLTISAGESRWDIFLDETTEAIFYNSVDKKTYFSESEALTVIDGVGHLLLAADEDGEDNLIYVDYVELYDEASVYEGKLPHYSKAGLTGEWMFPKGDVCKASIGQNLARTIRTGASAFTEGDDGVLPGDGHVIAGRNNYFRCYHGLPSDSNYTVVMDVRIPDNENSNQQWHALFMGSENSKDADVFIKKENGVLKIRTISENYTLLGAEVGEWVRFVIANTNGKNKTIYVNGIKKDTATKSTDTMKPVKGGYFVLLGDNDGEDWDVDMSYAAIYDRVLNDSEIAELHSRPLAQMSDGSFVPTVAPAGVWVADDAGALTSIAGSALSEGGAGALAWTRISAPDAATYIADIKLAGEQTLGGVFVKNSNGVASGIYGTSSPFSGSLSTLSDASLFVSSSSSAYEKAWGYWTLNALDRTQAHRIAVVWPKNGRVHYYVDGRPWGSIFPANLNTSASPSATMTFFEGLGAEVTRLAAYDVALTGDEIASLGAAGSAPEGAVAPSVPAVSATISSSPLFAGVGEVVFRVSTSHSNGEWISYAIDYGDGTGDVSVLMPSGTEFVFSHLYNYGGTFVPRVRAFSQTGAESEWALSDPIEVISRIVPASEMLVTWPWQQNVYTNRFTIMCEGVKDADNPMRYDGLEVQYGENYAQSAKMTRMESVGGTWIYKAQIVVDGMEGAEIPYRLGYGGMPLSFEDPSHDTSGTVKLWFDEESDFVCSIWGDNQEGQRESLCDWNADRFLYLKEMFTHMISRNVDFGISTGDMSSKGKYAEEIRPCILDTTATIFGKTRPYYVAWGNHDNSHPENKPFFETGAVNEFGSNSGNYHLYRNNVLFVFIDNGLMSKAETKTYLENLLATDRAKRAKFRILVHHYPFWGECWGSTNTALLESAKAGGIDIIFSGHMHGYERFFKDGLIQVTNGGAGYLDHVERIAANYGDATIVGGHRDVPYLYARQKSSTEEGVLGPAMPVRMGCIQSYGELKVEENVLTYSAHGFNANGSYIGVFDSFSVTSRTVAVSQQVVLETSDNFCADPSAFAQFLSKPVTKAMWKEYKNAVGEDFAFADGEDEKPVVNVSKDEIGQFLNWLNGSTGTYRLPTVQELEVAFGGEMRREVAEWTSSIAPGTGWCRILGSPAKSLEGTWSRASDRPCIATSGCHADYLGFRLAEGEVPPQEVSPFDAALAALSKISEPAQVYKWVDGQLVDISSDWAAPSGDISYEDLVIFTGTGEITYDTGAFNVIFGGGLAAPNSTAFVKNGSGALLVKGAVKSGECTSETGWKLASGGTLELDGVNFFGETIRFRSGDNSLRLNGENDFSSVDIYVGNAEQECTNYIASTTAVLKARRISNKGSARFGIGGGVGVRLEKDLLYTLGFELVLDGELDAEAVNACANVDSWISGCGTLRVGSIGTYNHSWLRLAVPNIVFTSACPLRSNSYDLYQALFVAGDTVRISSLCDWSIAPFDNFGKPVYILANTDRVERPQLEIAGEYNIDYSPSGSLGTFSTIAKFSSPWDVKKVGDGILTISSKMAGDLSVTSGTALIHEYPCEGTAVASDSGKWAIDGKLVLGPDKSISGTFIPGGALEYVFSHEIPGCYLALNSSGLKDGDLEISTSLDEEFTVERQWKNDGSLSLMVHPKNDSCVWTGAGDMLSLDNPDNWLDKKVPNGTVAYIGTSEASEFSVSADGDFAPSAIVLIPGSASVVIAGNKTLEGVCAVTNLASNVLELACPVKFADKFSVHCESMPVIFSGGAWAKCPDPENPDNAASHTLSGEFHFTDDWHVDYVLSSPYTVTEGSKLYAKSMSGSKEQLNLRVKEGGTANFSGTVYTGGNCNRVSVEGLLEAYGWVVINTGVQGHVGFDGDEKKNGIIKAHHVWKGDDKENMDKAVYVKIPHLYVGEGGLGANRQHYSIHFDGGNQVVYAMTDFEIFGPENTNGDWCLYIDKTTTFNTCGHTITWTGALGGGGVVEKAGEGKLVMNPHSSANTGGVVVSGGSLALAKSKAVGTGTLTVKKDAMLEVSGTDPVSLGCPLNLESGAGLTFVFTDRTASPMLEIGSMTYDNENLKICITSSKTLRPLSGIYTLACGDGVQFDPDGVFHLQNKPNWVKRVFADPDDGFALKLEVGSVGMNVIVR